MKQTFFSSFLSFYRSFVAAQAGFLVLVIVIVARSNSISTLSPSLLKKKLTNSTSSHACLFAWSPRSNIILLLLDFKRNGRTAASAATATAGMAC